MSPYIFPLSVYSQYLEPRRRCSAGPQGQQPHAEVQTEHAAGPTVPAEKTQAILQGMSILSVVCMYVFITLGLFCFLCLLYQSVFVMAISLSHLNGQL